MNAEALCVCFISICLSLLTHDAKGKNFCSSIDFLAIFVFEKSYLPATLIFHVFSISDIDKNGSKIACDLSGKN